MGRMWYRTPGGTPRGGGSFPSRLWSRIRDTSAKLAALGVTLIRAGEWERVTLEVPVICNGCHGETYRVFQFRLACDDPEECGGDPVARRYCARCLHDV